VSIPKQKKQARKRRKISVKTENPPVLTPRKKRRSRAPQRFIDEYLSNEEKEKKRQGNRNGTSSKEQDGTGSKKRRKYLIKKQGKREKIHLLKTKAMMSITNSLMEVKLRVSIQKQQQLKNEVTVLLITILGRIKKILEKTTKNQIKG